MRNARNTKKIIALATMSLVVGLLSITGCRNALQVHGGPEDAAATGYLSLTIGSGKARTIFTAIELEDLDAFSFNLELVHMQNTANNIYISGWDGSLIGNMATGDWELTVTAFLPAPDGGGLVAAARTAVPVLFAVNPGQTTYLFAVYVLPLPGGDGWFSWDLVLPPGASGWIRVTDLYGAEIGVGVSAEVPGRIFLLAGQHRVHLSLSFEGTDITINRLLNVYAGMTSHWNETFTPNDFHRSFLDYFLELWDGLSWDLSEVQAGHFGILRTDEGIEGVYAHNIAGIRHWFNAIYRLSGHPGYNTAVCLGTLVDAALVGIGTQEFFANEFDGAQDDAEAVISGFVRNHTVMTFAWSSNIVVATIGNRYILEIYVRFPEPEPLAIIFYGNGYTGPTLPQPVYAFAGQEIALPDWYADRQIDDYWFAFHGWIADSGSIFLSPGQIFVTRDYEVTFAAVWSAYGFAFCEYGCCGITGFSGGSNNIAIPSVINGMSVTYIGDSAFANHQLSSVWIPPSVTHIGGSAFADNWLLSVDIPWSVTYIGGSAFANNWLSFVDIPSSVTYIGDSAFANNQLSSVEIPWGLTHIAYMTFANNPLSSITMPGGISIYDLGWPHTMGIHGDSFLAFYDDTGQRAGTYLWLQAENRWIFYGDTGVAVFAIVFTGFTDGEADIGFDQSVSILSPEALITVVGDFDGIRWFYAGEIVPDANGETLDFARLHGNRIGMHFVTVEVLIDGRWYNSQIRINVTR